MLKDKHTRQPKWTTDATSHPLFSPIRPQIIQIRARHSDWPQLKDYQRFLQSAPTPVVNSRRHALQLVPQCPKPLNFEQHYEPRIYLRAELQTRLQSWHDFFQVLVWRLFPQSKRAINQLHFQAAHQRYVNTQDTLGNNAQSYQSRSAMENALTLFDECGAIIVSSDASLLNMVRNFEWLNLFWHKRQELSEKLKVIVFGHALYEKGLTPYIGMTANCLLIYTTPDLVTLAASECAARLDSYLQGLLLESNCLHSPAALTPFPLLGMPLWHEGNHTERFYHNKHYFRCGRNKGQSAKIYPIQAGINL